MVHSHNGSNPDVYEHSTDEGWDSDVSRLRTRDWDGPRRVCTGHIPMNQVGYVIVLIDADGERTLPCFLH